MIIAQRPQDQFKLVKKLVKSQNKIKHFFLEKPLGITGLEIAEGISKGLAKESILVELNGQLRDLSFSIKL